MSSFIIPVVDVDLPVALESNPLNSPVTPSRSLEYWVEYQPKDQMVRQVEAGLKRGDFLLLRGLHVGYIEVLRRADAAARRLFLHGDDLLEARFGNSGFPWFRQRGFSPSGTEQAVGADSPDIHRRFWMTGLLHEHGPDADPLDTRYDRIDADPDGLSPDFGSSVRLLMRHKMFYGRTVIRCIEEIFGFDPGLIVEMTLGSDSVLRTLCYHLRGLPEGTIGAAEHEDINLFTELSSFNMNGLELLIDGQWVRPVIPPGSLLFNTGEMAEPIPGLEQLNRVRHRVVKARDTPDVRIQFATFMHAKRGAVLRPAMDGNEPVICGPWFDQRIAEITKK